jgi:excisionase family DNA binding protein
VSSKHTDTPKEEHYVMTVRQASGFLKLSESIVRRGIKRKTIPFYQIGKRYFLSRPALESWIAERIVKPAQEPTPEDVSERVDSIWNNGRRSF